MILGDARVKMATVPNKRANNNLYLQSFISLVVRT